ncbi:MAG: hypothetical protein HY368_00485 [Candidatus Aenigmarchaeota archaeon]|nr:hypothetical protein [Candidatus Aenigmarchaeota archaeon]
MDDVKKALENALHPDFSVAEFMPRQPGVARIATKDQTAYVDVFVHLNVRDSYTRGDIQGLKKRLDAAVEPYLFGCKKAAAKNSTAATSNE